MFFISTVSTFAYDSDQNIVVMLSTSLNEEYEQVPIHTGKHRSSPQSTVCIITTSGISIQGYENVSATCFEIYGEFGELEASFTDEVEFITMLFSLSGSHKISIHIGGKILIGFVEI